MTFWIVLLFVLQLFMGVTSGRSDFITVQRSTRVFYAIAQFAAIVLAYLDLLGTRFFGRKAKPIGSKDIRGSRGFVLLFLWVVVALVSALMGAVSGYQVTFVLGDCYKLLLLPLLYTLACFSISTERQLWFLLCAIAVVFGAALLVDFVRNYTSIRGGESFTTSTTYHIGTLNTLVLFLILSRRGGPWFRRLLWAIAVEIVISIVLLQGFFDYFSVTLALTLFILYSPNKKLLLVIPLVAGLAFIGILDPFHVFGDKGTYAFGKLEYAVSESRGSTLRLAERATGFRLGQIHGILLAYDESPEKLAFGFGLAKDVDMLPLTMNPAANDVHYYRRQHFIESSLFEVFYRTGLAGTLMLVAFFYFCYRRGKTLVTGPHRQFGVFVMVNTLYQFINIMMETPMEYVWLFLVIPVVGTFVLEHRPEETAAMARARLTANATEARGFAR